MAEFAGDLDLHQVSRAVLDARHDLACSPGEAMPELAERATRQRLVNL